MLEIVQIKWLDAQTFEGWKTDEEITDSLQDSMEVTTIGYMIANNDNYIAVVQSISLETKDSVLQIPKQCVISINKLTK